MWALTRPPASSQAPDQTETPAGRRRKAAPAPLPGLWQRPRACRDSGSSDLLHKSRRREAPGPPWETRGGHFSVRATREAPRTGLQHGRPPAGKHPKGRQAGGLHDPQPRRCPARGACPWVGLTQDRRQVRGAVGPALEPVREGQGALGNETGSEAWPPGLHWNCCPSGLGRLSEQTLPSGIFPCLPGHTKFTLQWW